VLGFEDANFACPMLLFEHSTRIHQREYRSSYDPSNYKAVQAVFCDKLPQLFYEKLKFTGLDQHGYQCGFPLWPDPSLPVEYSVRLLAIGQIWQTLLGIVIINTIWMSMIQGSNAFYLQKEENLAIAIFGTFKQDRYASEKNVSWLELQSVSCSLILQVVDRSLLIL
jgi:hypothetical protein